MIELPSGVRFDFACASGALGFDGRGWWWERMARAGRLIDWPDDLLVIAKTVTYLPRRGNLRMWAPWRCVRLLPRGGTVNAVGLSNPGLEAWLWRHWHPRYVDEWTCVRPVRLAPSFQAETVQEARSIVSRTGGCPFPLIEVNASCPNVAGDPSRLGGILHEFRAQGAPLILKLSESMVRPDLIREVDHLVDAFSAINTVPWGDIYGTRPSPLGRHTGGMAGGVSGPIIKPAAIEAVRRLRGMTRKPIVGGGGIFTLDDVYEFEAAGADAFSLGTVFLHRPWRPRQIVEEYRAAVGSEVKS